VNRPIAVAAALRVRDWVKNTLVLVPALVAGRVADPALLPSMTFAFLAFGFAASSAYVLNDILDRSTDRQDPTKRHRPFATGAVSVETGLIFESLLLSLAIAAALLAPSGRLLGVLAIYVILSTAYSACIKHIVFADIAVLTALYTLRVIGGAVVCSIPVSPWLVACSMSGFASLASLKRYAELQLLAQGTATHVPGRPYHIGHRHRLQWLGVLAAVVCVLTLIGSRGGNWLLWARGASGACLAYWMARSWILACRGRLGSDPLTFAVRDPDSYAVGAVVAAALMGRG